MTGLIEDLVVKAITRGELPDVTPGLTLTRRASGDLEFQIGAQTYIAPPLEAQQIFRWLGQGLKNIPSQRRIGTSFRSLEIRKAGTALVIEIRRSGRPSAKFSITGRVPADLRRQIAAAYKDDEWLQSLFRD